MPSEEKKKRRHAKDDKFKDSNDVFSHDVFTSFGAEISFFRVVDFVFSSFCMALFCLFARRLYLSFRIAFFRFYYIFSRGVFASRKDEMAQSSHQTNTLSMNISGYSIHLGG